ncbi:MAG: LPS assembly lipoprotein LptE [Magnetovibrio sp.]|nr:LPS assembly lipoprotein LptE [Magnetovibrio sp.]
MSLFNILKNNTKTYMHLLAFGGLFASSLTLSGCGYTPLYASNGANSDITPTLKSIEIKHINDRVGQMTRTALKRRFAITAKQSAQPYMLTVTLSESISTLAIEKDASATRANLRLTATYALTRKIDDAPLTSGSVKGVSSYNIINSDFATEAAKKNARARAVDFVAESIRTRLAAYFNGPGKKQPPINKPTYRY